MAQITTCQTCKKPMPSHLSACPYCKSIVTTQNETTTLNDINSASKYPALAAYIIIIKIVAALPVIAAGIVLFIDIPITSKIIGIIASIIWCVLIWASSEGLQIFIDMEENQRKIISILDWKNNGKQ